MIAFDANLSILQTVQGHLEQQVLDYVKKSVPQGDSQAVLDAIDSFVFDKGMLINIGKSKGRLVESVISQHQPMVGMSLSVIGILACACMFVPHLQVSQVCLKLVKPAGGPHRQATCLASDALQLALT